MTLLIMCNNNFHLWGSLFFIKSKHCRHNNLIYMWPVIVSKFLWQPQSKCHWSAFIKKMKFKMKFINAVKYMDLWWINWLPIYFLLRILNFDTIIGIWAGGRGLGFKRNIGIENWDRSFLVGLHLLPHIVFILHPTLLTQSTE